ncbi:hypothetical protein EMIT0P265_10084 [Pseudomonas zeae]
MTGRPQRHTSMDWQATSIKTEPLNVSLLSDLTVATNGPRPHGIFGQQLVTLVAYIAVLCL